MKTIKHLTSVLITSAALSCSMAQAATTIKIANFFPDAHPVNIALKDTFAKEVEKLSDGDLKVRIYSNGILGGNEKIYNSVRSGTVNMAVLGTDMDDEVKNVGIIQLPFLFKNYEHAQNVLASDIGLELVSDMEEKIGLHFLGYGVQGFRVIASNRKIDSMDAFDGVRLRFPGMASMIAIGDSLGANVTPLPISEVFSALEQRVVDGVENPYPNILASKWYEVVDNITESNHVFTPNLHLVNSKFWNSLSAEHQGILQTAMDKATKKEWELLVSGEQANKEELMKKGVTITVPSSEFRQGMVNAVQPSYDAFYAKNPDAKAIVAKIQAATPQ